MSLVVEGKLHKAFAAVQVSDRFKKREFVLEMVNERGYTEHPKFQLTQARCSLLDAYNEGEEIRIHFNLTGRAYQTRSGETTYFTNLNVWKIERVAQEPPPPPQTQTSNMRSGRDMPPPMTEAEASKEYNPYADDNLPF